jgi:hypothetical protein
MVSRNGSLLFSPSLVDAYLAQNESTNRVFNETIVSGRAVVSGEELVTEHFDPMIEWIYARIRETVAAATIGEDEVKLYIGELSVFARYNSTLLLRAANTVRDFCPELAHEFLRNFLEEGGERGKLPAHYVIFSGALIHDLGFRVNGWLPQTPTTLALSSIIDLLAWSHCPSTILGMYYATEAVAIAETEQLRDLTDRLGELLGRGTRADLKKLDYYYKMHLDEGHEAATAGVAVEQGHQEGIARFIKQADLFGFLHPQIVDGFLQMLYPFSDQWTGVHNFISSARDRLSP